MTKLTVIQAARAGYAGRATIYRKLNAGLLNAETDDNGTTVIEPTELIRVFGEPPPARETSRETPLSTLLRPSVCRPRTPFFAPRTRTSACTAIASWPSSNKLSAALIDSLAFK